MSASLFIRASRFGLLEYFHAHVIDVGRPSITPLGAYVPAFER